MEDQHSSVINLINLFASRQDLNVEMIQSISAGISHLSSGTFNLEEETSLVKADEFG